MRTNAIAQDGRAPTNTALADAYSEGQFRNQQVNPHSDTVNNGPPAVFPVTFSDGLTGAIPAGPGSPYEADAQQQYSQITTQSYPMTSSTQMGGGSAAAARVPALVKDQRSYAQPQSQTYSEPAGIYSAFPAGRLPGSSVAQAGYASQNEGSQSYTQAFAPSYSSANAPVGSYSATPNAGTQTTSVPGSGFPAQTDEYQSYSKPYIPTMTTSVSQDQNTTAQYATTPGYGAANGFNINGSTDQDYESSSRDSVDVLCGPLLNYKHMSDAQGATPIWHGSVLLVTKPADVPPKLRLRFDRHTEESMNSQNSSDLSQPRTFKGFKLYSDPVKAFWRFDIDLPLQSSEARWEYTIPNLRFVNGVQDRARSTKDFYVPSKYESMRIMFHSCNGFSVGTDEEAWSGPALWNDVLRFHEQKPFHVMIGGGDQIYNDNIRVSGPLKEWTAIHNPVKRREYPFGEDLRARCDEHYFNNYVHWYSTEKFASANGRIAQINIWDDHDIIDGFGSYTDRFMRSPVFRGVGGVAQKYYLLFQHHTAPPVSSFTTDAPQMFHKGKDGAGADPVQTKNCFVLRDQPEDPSFIVGPAPGPYIPERSRSVFMRLGRRIAFLGIDARTERTRRQINYPETYDVIFQRVEKELTRAGGEIEHLIVLLGVPIAYPRLIWLENILRSPIIGPIRFLNKRFGVAGSFFNSFDGSVDLLDDLDDHYTAHQHKKERKILVNRLQTVAATHAVRISILGGDVHLAALGRFYSNLDLRIPIARDHRYMVNIISSAITNKPPPNAVANMIARRNKIHHLDHDTDETLLNLFDKQPGGNPKAGAANHCTMPSRNYAIITETASRGGAGGDGANGALPDGAVAVDAGSPAHPPKQGSSALHAGEENAGTSHPAAPGLEARVTPGQHGLDATFRVEIDRADREGRTDGYGLFSEFSFPWLGFYSSCSLLVLLASVSVDQKLTSGHSLQQFPSCSSHDLPRCASTSYVLVYVYVYVSPSESVRRSIVRMVKGGYWSRFVFDVSSADGGRRASLS